MFLILLLLFFTSGVTAQNYFQQEMQQNKAYFDSTGVGTDTLEGGDYAGYQRKLSFWSERLLPDKDYSDYRQQMLNAAANYSTAQSNASSSSKTWHLIGTNGDDFTGGNYTGQIHYIYFPNPADTTHLFACSPTGGLFESDDAANSWQNAGTDKGLPKSGVSSICIDNHNYWYITTGNGEGFRHHPQWRGAIGVYRSMNRGATWECIGLDKEKIDGMRKVIEVPDNNHDSTRLLVTTTYGLCQSRDANTVTPHWDTIIFGDFYDVRLKPDDYTVAFASGSSTTPVYKINLVTGVKTIIAQPDTIIPNDSLADDFKWTRRTVLNIVPSAPDYLYAITSGRGSRSFLYRYKISTGKWVKRGNIGSAFTSYGRGLSWTISDFVYNDTALFIYGKNTGDLYVIKDTLNDIQNDYLNKIRVTTSGGDSPHADCHYLYINPVSKKIWQCNDGGLYKGSFVNDTAVTWQVKNYGLAVSNVEYLDVNNNGDFVTCGAFDNGSRAFSTGHEIDWQTTFAGGGDGYQTVINNENDFFITTQEGGIFRYIADTSHYLFGCIFFPEKDFNCTPTNDSVPYANFSTYYQTTSNYLYMTGRKEIRRCNLTTLVWDSISKFSDPAVYPEMGCNHSGTWEIEVINNNLMYVSTYGNPEKYHNYFAVYKYLPQANNRKWEWLGTPPSSYADGWIGAIHRNEHNITKSIYVGKGPNMFYVHWNNNDVQSLHNAVWTDITYNLDIGRVQHINAIEQDEHGLYIATDGGVFYKPRFEQHWYDFTGSLPNTMVKDIKLANSQLYVATYGRGVWYASAPGCEGDGDTVYIKNNTLYNTPNVKYNTIFVENGATLTVTSELKMGVNAKIIVDRGARLVIDGGTITHACPDLWPGVELRGTANGAQDNTHQGMVIIHNNGSIQFAVTGIKTIATFAVNDSTFYDDVAYSGGIVFADTALFRNNIKDVWFFPYPKNIDRFSTLSISHFNKTTFLTDTAYYYFTREIPIHVEMEDIAGILLKNSLFENTTSLNFVNDDERGMGIEAWSAGFYAQGVAETSTGSRFSKLNYGIKTYAFSGSNKTIKIDHNIFEYNKTGCYLGAETYATVTRNTFVVKRADNLLPYNYCGLYLDASTGYTVEENVIYSDYNPQFQQSYSRCYGLVVNNSGPEDNLIYNNTFHNISWALQAQNQNRSKDGQTGLQIKCNDFQNNWQDISVSAAQSGNNYGVRTYQGSDNDLITAPAGNTFSHLGSANNLYSDYWNGCEDITYWHHRQTLTPPPYVIPVYKNDGVTNAMNFNISYFNKSQACPSNLNNKSYTDTKSDIASAESNRTVYADSLDNLVDEGNTTSLNLDVVTSMPPETMQLRDQLLNASPYLSDTVMVNAAEKEEVLPNSIVTEILTENPQSAKSDKVLNKLNERNNPPDDNQMAQIHANDTVTGHKEKMESKKAYFAGEKANEVYRLVRMYMSDTAISAKADSIESALANINTPASRYQQAFCRYNRGDSTDVLNLLSNIPSDFDLSTSQTDYHNYFEDYFDLLLNVQYNQTPFAQIDSTQKAVLYNIANNTSGLLHAYARNLLIYTDGLEYHEPYLEIDTANMKTAKVNSPAPDSYWKQDAYFKLYPNPAREYLTLEYKLDYRTKNPVVEIFTLNGIHVETFRLHGTTGVKIIDLRQWNTGTYIIRLSNNGKTLQNEKFVKF